MARRSDPRTTTRATAFGPTTKRALYAIAGAITFQLLMVFSIIAAPVILILGSTLTISILGSAMCIVIWLFTHDPLFLRSAGIGIVCGFPAAISCGLISFAVTEIRARLAARTTDATYHANIQIELQPYRPQRPCQSTCARIGQWATKQAAEQPLLKSVMI